MTLSVFGAVFVAAPSLSAPSSAAAPSLAPASSAPASSAPTSSAPTSSAPTSSAPAQPASTPLGLRDALHDALGARLDVGAARERAVSKAAVVDVNLLPFIPRLVPTLSIGQRQVPIAGPFTSFFQPDDVVVTRDVVAGVAVAGDLPVGPSYQLSVASTVSWFSSYAESINPRYEPALRLRLSQRLWRGVSTDITLAPRAAAIAAAAAEAALVDVRVDVVLAEVSDAWLAAARAEALLEPRRRSIESALQFQKLTQQLIDGGSLSALDLALAKQLVAQRQADLSAAELERNLARLSLARALGGVVVDDDAAAVDVDAVPDAPDVAAIDAADRAVARSPSLRVLRANLTEIAHLRRRAADDKNPDIRVFVDGGVSGLSGTATCKEGFLSDGISACNVPAAYDGGVDRALVNLATAKGYAVGVGISGDIPLWFTPNDAGLAARDHDSAAVTAEIDAITRRLRADAHRLTAEVAARRALVDLRTQNVALAQNALAAEEQKLRAGRSSGFALASAQGLAIDAEVQATQARFDLAAAGLRLRAFMGTLLGDLPADDVSGAPAPPR